MSTIDNYGIAFGEIQPTRAKTKPIMPTVEEVEDDVELLDRESINKEASSGGLNDLPRDPYDITFGRIQPIAADHRKPGFLVEPGAPQRGALPTFKTEEGIEYSPYDLPISESRRLQAKPKPVPKTLRAPSKRPPQILTPKKAVQTQIKEDLRGTNILMTPKQEKKESPKNLQAMGFKFKKNVAKENYEVRKEMLPVAAAVKRAYAKLGLATPMITSAKRDKKSFSFHELGLGLDFRVNDIPMEKRKSLYDVLMQALPNGAEIDRKEFFDATDEAHLHVEFDTKETKAELIKYAKAMGIKVPAKYRTKKT
jgi:hypothetical protein